MAANIGARFVTIGASAVFSYWKTKVEGTSDYDKQMWSVNLGGQLQRFTINADLMRYDKIVSGATNGGTVTTLDVRYRLFKENYLLLNTAVSNVAKDLSEGKASDLSIGYKSYFMTGIEFEVLFAKKSETKSSVESVADYVQTQLHLYF